MNPFTTELTALIQEHYPDIEVEAWIVAVFLATMLPPFAFACKASVASKYPPLPALTPPEEVSS